MRLPIIVLAVAANLLAAVAAACAANPTTDILALTGATIYTNPTDPPIRKGVILIKDGVITAVGKKGDVAIPRGAQTLNLKGSFVTAGLWNSHVHFFERKWAGAASMPAPELNQQLEEMFTQYGFTSVFDLSSSWQDTKALRNRIEQREIDGPRIRSTGGGLVAPGAVPSDQVLGIMGLMTTPLPKIANKEEALNAVEKLLDEDVDAIKLFAPRPGGTAIPENAVNAVITQTHRNGKLVFIHPNSGGDVLAALNAGADIIVHTTPHSGNWEDAIFAVAKEKRSALTPTLSLWTYYARHDRTSARGKIAETATQQLRGWFDAGGIVLFGTDAGANQYDPGEEYRLMAQAGMRFSDILASLTTAPAAFFGDSERLGTIEAGRNADMAIFGSDPARDINALGDVRYTIRSGKITFAKPSAQN